MKQSKMEIFVFGASGHAKVVIDIIEKQGRYKIAFLADDDVLLKDKEVYSYRVIGGQKELTDFCNKSGIEYGIVAIGNNASRIKIAGWLKSREFTLAIAIHPSVQIARGVFISPGTVVMANAVINSDSLIGENVIVNTGAKIDHDCMIGEGVHIAPGATLCGGVSVGTRSLIGAGSVIIPNIKIGSDVIVGAGSTVVRDIPDGITIIDVGKKIIKSRGI